MRKSLLWASLLLLVLSSSAFASGFAITEQSVSGLGTAFSTGSATAEDASAMFFNPATMTQIKGQQVVGGIHVIVPSAKLTITEANSAAGPISGGNGIDGGQTGEVPNLYYVNNTGNGLAFGLGINAPFGLSTDYGTTWIGRYHAVKSDVITININPAVAYQVNDKLSVGAGVSAMYMKATLSSMVNGGLAAYQASSGLVGTPNSPGDDIFVENKADDWSYGYNLGLTYLVTDNTRVGFAYRSKVKQELEGDATTSVPTSVSILAPAFQNQGVNGTIELPASASLSVSQKVNEKLTLLADVTWTEWSSFDKLTMNYEGAGLGGNSSSTTVENWDDTVRYSAGAIYQYNDALKLRCGVAFDPTPIPDAAHRTPRIPGEDRIWVAVGAGYKFTEHLSGDFGYSHLFVDDSKLDQSLADNPAAGSLVGSSENSVDIISAQLTLNF